MNPTPNVFLSMEHLRRWTRSALLATLAIGVGSVALGEQQKSGVQVDLSVLEEMGPRKPISSTDRIVVRRPGEAGPGQAARPARASVRTTQPAATSPPPLPAAPSATEQPAFGAGLPAMRASDEPVEEAIEAVSEEEVAAAADDPPADVVTTEEAAEEPAETEEIVSEEADSEDAAAEPETSEAGVAETAEESTEESGEVVAAVEEEAEAEESPALAEPLETVQVEERPALGPADQVEQEEEAEATEEAEETVETEQAALPPEAGGAGSLRVLFQPGSAELSDDADDALESLADRMNDDPDLRVELLAYAPEDEVEERLARRLSLSRALAIRLYLTEEGIAGTRTLVRALGGSTDDGPVDRVDVILGGQ